MFSSCKPIKRGHSYLLKKSLGLCKCIKKWPHKMCLPCNCLIETFPGNMLFPFHIAPSFAWVLTGLKGYCWFLGGGTWHPWNPSGILYQIHKLLIWPWFHTPGFTFECPSCPYWRRKWQSTPALLPGKSHGQRSLEGYSPWGRKESDTTERFVLPSGLRGRLCWLSSVFHVLLYWYFWGMVFHLLWIVHMCWQRGQWQDGHK